MTPAEFIALIAPAAQASAETTHIPYGFTVAEAALESAWGAKAPGMNLFGIKADHSWAGETVIISTHEVINGESIPVSAKFRAYSTWQASLDDHAKFLTENPRYTHAFDHEDPCDFAEAVAEAGYATDPQYAQKIISIIHTHDLV